MNIKPSGHPDRTHCARGAPARPAQKQRAQRPRQPGSTPNKHVPPRYFTPLFPRSRSPPAAPYPPASRGWPRRRWRCETFCRRGRPSPRRQPGFHWEGFPAAEERRRQRKGGQGREQGAEARVTCLCEVASGNGDKTAGGAGRDKTTAVFQAHSHPQCAAPIIRSNSRKTGCASCEGERWWRATHAMGSLNLSSGYRKTVLTVLEYNFSCTGWPARSLG